MLYKTTMKKINLILACTFSGGIGYKNRLPWKMTSELKKFKEITTSVKNRSHSNAVIMGRKTWESLECPLNNRVNIVITSKKQKQEDDNVLFMDSICSALVYCDITEDIESVFCIGGASIYDVVLTNYLYKIESIYMSVMFHDNYKIDNYFDIRLIYEMFDIHKDERYSKECKKREYASYICYPKFSKIHELKRILESMDSM